MDASRLRKVGGCLAVPRSGKTLLCAGSFCFARENLRLVFEVLRGRERVFQKKKHSNCRILRFSRIRVVEVSLVWLADCKERDREAQVLGFPFLISLNSLNSLVSKSKCNERCKKRGAFWGWGWNGLRGVYNIGV
jgi:hypothetical protein